MKYTVIIEGGIGRVVCAIPALEKFVIKNPETLILCHGWSSLFWGNPILQKLVYEDNTKGLFDRIKKTKIIHPEPYHNTKYINDEIHLIQAFDEELNGTIEFLRPYIHLTPEELSLGRKFIIDYGNTNKKTVVFQPFGSTVALNGDVIVDSSNKSLNAEQANFIVKQLSQHYNIFLIVPQHLEHLVKEAPCIIINSTAPLRTMITAINVSDYFIGVDSCGQHIAFCYNKPGVVFMGGTSVTNCSYHTHYNIIEKKLVEKPYTPYRICEFDAYLSNLIKKDCMSFTQDELQQVVDLINQQLLQR